MKLIHGDSNEELLKITGVDTIITDPPYGLSFMGKKWDYDVPSVQFWKVALASCKPGATALVFAGSRTSHRMACNMEDAGWILKDTIMWLYGSGFPKATDISKQFDKTQGLKRTGIIKTDGSGSGEIRTTSDRERQLETTYETGEPVSDEAKLWNGWKSHGLKPAYEPIIVAMKPNDGTYANNALKHGVSGLNIDGGRIGMSEEDYKKSSRPNFDGTDKTTDGDSVFGTTYMRGELSKQGRFPANLLLSCECEMPKSRQHSAENSTPLGDSGLVTQEYHEENCPVKMLDEQSGERKGWAGQNHSNFNPYGGNALQESKTERSGYHKGFNDKGGASRFFYCAKSSKRERNNGLDCTLTVKYNSGICKEDNMVAVQLLKKVTYDTETVSFNIDESGENIMALCHKDSLSTILTTTNKTIELKTLNSLRHFITSGFIQGANSEVESGGSPAESVESLSKWLLTTTNGNQESARGVSNAVLEMLLTIKYEENWSPLTNIHSTVKPLALMEYLVKLTATPTGGTVLDPFMGSGTTGIACKNQGRDFIGIELDEEYYEIAKARIGI